MLDFLIEIGWKSATICILSLVLCTLMRSRSAADKATVLRAAVLLLLLLPSATLLLPPLQIEALPWASFLQSPSLRSETSVGDIFLAASSAGEAAAAVAVPPLSHVAGGLVTALYLAGLLLIAGRLAAGLWTLKRWASAAHEITSPAWTEAVLHARAQAGGMARLRVLVSDDVRSPVSWGVRRPVILIDMGSLDRPGDAAAILAHEVAHVARGDWPALILSRVALALFWFNPLVWLVARSLGQHAEEAADVQAVQRVEPKGYARSLLSCLTSAGGGRAPANCMVSTHGLARRVEAILDADRRRMASRSPWTLAAIGVCAEAAFTTAALDLVAAERKAPARYSSPIGLVEAPLVRTPNTGAFASARPTSTLSREAQATNTVFVQPVLTRRPAATFAARLPSSAHNKPGVGQNRQASPVAPLKTAASPASNTPLGPAPAGSVGSSIQPPTGPKVSVRPDIRLSFSPKVSVNPKLTLALPLNSLRRAGEGADEVEGSQLTYPAAQAAVHRAAGEPG